MDTQMLTELIILAVVIVSGIITIIVAIRKGKLKQFIQSKMLEAEEKYKFVPKPERSIKKLQYVVDEVKKEYALTSMFLNIEKFIAKMIDFVNSMNGKK